MGVLGTPPAMEDDEQAGEWRVPGRRSHPLYKKLASLSGEVNGLSNDKVKQKLAVLGLSDRYKLCPSEPIQLYTRCSVPSKRLPRGYHKAPQAAFASGSHLVRALQPS